MSEISVSAGATLEVAGLAQGEKLALKDGVTLNVDCSKTTGTAVISGLAFPKNGTVNLVNCQRGKNIHIAMDTSASAGFVSNVGQWTVTKDGEPTGVSVAVNENGITVIPSGLFILLR